MAGAAVLTRGDEATAYKEGDKPMVVFLFHTASRALAAIAETRPFME